MTVDATPPVAAEMLLRILLPADDFEVVSGDLLEEYRERVYPLLGRGRAALWYVTQVLGFAWRNARVWAALFAIAFISRTGMDWLLPTDDFHTRSAVSTSLGIGIVLLAGFWAASRSGSFVAGAVLGAATTAIAVPMDFVGAVTLLGIWHDPATLAAIRGSGGIQEVFTLPIALVLPGILIGTIGGVLGAVTRRLRSA